MNDAATSQVAHGTSRRFGRIAFDPQFLSCHNKDGQTAVFTRQERAVLQHLIRNTGQLCTRRQLMTALADTGRQATLRTIDLLVTRLRAKLGDDARRPDFIVTQYGEGYRWIAAEDMAIPDDTLLLICPLHGVSHAPSPHAARRTLLLSMLCRTLDAQLGEGRRASMAPHGAIDQLPPDHIARYVLEASLYEDTQGLHIAFVLRTLPQRLVLGTSRHLAPDGIGNVDAMADWVREQVWRHMLLPPARSHEPTELPLELRLHEATMALARSPSGWVETEEQLVRLCVENPQDPVTRILSAMQKYTQLLRPDANALPSAAEWCQAEREIEDMVFAALPGIASHPLLVLAAARLLCFIDCGHIDLAERMAADAFAQSTAFAAAHATRGQILLCHGDTDAALRLFEDAIPMAEPGSEFHVYLLVLKCQALMCAGSYAQAQAALETLCTVKPAALRKVGLFLIAPDRKRLPPELSAMFAALTLPAATRILEYFDRMAVRQLRVHAQRCNLLRGPVRQMVSRFGIGVLPPRIREDMAQELNG